MNNKTFLLSLALLVGVVCIGFFTYMMVTKDSVPNSNITTIPFDETGNLVKDNPGLPQGVWHFVYELPGQPGIMTALQFDEKSLCQRNGKAEVCDISKFAEGDRVNIKGTRDGSGVLVRNLSFLQSSSEDTLPVKLYFYNPALDQGPGGVQCSEKGLVAVERVIPKTNTLIQDVVKLQLRGEISDEERAQGLTSEFPLSGFSLKAASLTNGNLTLTFDDPQNKTSGGSCRVNILWRQIEATALQFKEVTSVRFMPEELFQP